MFERFRSLFKKYRYMKNRYGDHGSYQVEVQRIMESIEKEK